MMPWSQVKGRLEMVLCARLLADLTNFTFVKYLHSVSVLYLSHVQISFLYNNELNFHFMVLVHNIAVMLLTIW